jgi:hypothetical protein
MQNGAKIAIAIVIVILIIIVVFVIFSAIGRSTQPAITILPPANKPINQVAQAQQVQPIQQAQIVPQAAPVPIGVGTIAATRVFDPSVGNNIAVRQGDVIELSGSGSAAQKLAIENGQPETLTFFVRNNAGTDLQLDSNENFDFAGMNGLLLPAGKACFFTAHRTSNVTTGKQIYSATPILCGESGLGVLLHHEIVNDNADSFDKTTSLNDAVPFNNAIPFDDAPTFNDNLPFVDRLPLDNRSI